MLYMGKKRMEFSVSVMINLQKFLIRTQVAIL